MDGVCPDCKRWSIERQGSYFVCLTRICGSVFTEEEWEKIRDRELLQDVMEDCGGHF